MIDDFNDGDDEGWEHNNFVEGTPWGPAIYDPSSRKVGDREPADPTLTVTDRELGSESGSSIAAIEFFDPVPLKDAGVEEVLVSGAVDNITFTEGRDH